MLAFSREVRDRRIDAPRTLRCNALIGVVVFVAGRDQRFRSLPFSTHWASAARTSCFGS